LFDKQRRIVVYLDSLRVKVNALRELQSKELGPLCPSDISPKGENYALEISGSMRIQSIMKTHISSKVNALRELQSPSLHFGDAAQSASGEESSALMPSIVDKAFKGKL
jgi:hypothetical protein